MCLVVSVLIIMTICIGCFKATEKRKDHFKPRAAHNLL
jgi:hypothetical protein